MKVKLDFITNSSSTCYIACVPLKLKPIKSVKELNDWDIDGHTEVEALELVTKGIEQLQNGEALWRDEDPLFWSVQYYLEKNGFILTSVDAAGGDGCDIIQPITTKKIEQFLERTKQYESQT